MNVIKCEECLTKYDGSKVREGARFYCVNCGATVQTAPPLMAGNGHPGASGKANAADQGHKLGPSAEPPHVSYPPPTASPWIGQDRSDWRAPQDTPQRRGYLMPIVLSVLTLGVYHYYWTWKQLRELPARERDFSSRKYFWNALVPGVVSTLFVMALFPLLFLGLSVDECNIKAPTVAYSEAYVAPAPVPTEADDSLEARIDAIEESAVAESDKLADKVEAVGEDIEELGSRIERIANPDLSADDEIEYESKTTIELGPQDFAINEQNKPALIGLGLVGIFVIGLGLALWSFIWHVVALFKLNDRMNDWWKERKGVNGKVSKGMLIGAIITSFFAGFVSLVLYLIWWVQFQGAADTMAEERNASIGRNA